MGHDIHMPAAFVAVQKQQVREQQQAEAGALQTADNGAPVASALADAPSGSRETFVFDDESYDPPKSAWIPKKPEDLNSNAIEVEDADLRTLSLADTASGSSEGSQRAHSRLPSSSQTTKASSRINSEVQSIAIRENAPSGPTGPNGSTGSTGVNGLNSSKPPLLRGPSAPTSKSERDCPQLRTFWTSTSSFSAGVDRYGFKKQSNYITEEAYNNWSVNYERYCARRKQKWIRFLNESGLGVGSDTAPPVRFPPHSQKLKRYVRKGIPPEWRGSAWWWYARGQDRLNSHPGLYEKLVSESKNLRNSDTEHIERDLHRTFPDNTHFRNHPITNQESSQLSSLRRVLTAFSVYQPKIGYCQSLNFIAGNLLLFMDEERAFWMLVIITQNYLAGLHEVNLEQVNISQGVLMISVRDRLPKIWHALGLEQVYEDNFITNLPPVSLCTASWFMSMMVNVLPTETMMRVWDCFFLEGPKILYRIALTLFKLVEPSITKSCDELEVFQAIQNIPRQLIDPSVLMGTCFKRSNGFGHLSADDIVGLKRFVQDRRKAVQNGQTSDKTTDRDEYAKFHPGRRLRAKLSMYK